MIVKQELEKLGLHYTSVELGKAEIIEDISFFQKEELKASLSRFGLELIDDRKSIISVRTFFILDKLEYITY